MFAINKDIKTSVAILGLLLVLSCRSQRSTQNVDVVELREKFPLIKTPISLPCHCGHIELSGNKILSEFLSNYERPYNPFYFCGKIFESDYYVALLGMIPAGPGSYFIITFDNNGKQIDSFPVLSNSSGYVVDSVSSDDSHLSAKIFSANQIITIDSTISYEVKMEQGVPIEIPETKTISIQKRRFKITEKGKVESVD